MKDWKSLLTLGTITGTALYIYYINYKKRRYPGPIQLPLIGTLLSVLPYVFKGKAHQMMLDFWQYYGDTFELVINGKKVIFLADGKEGRRILRESDKFHRGTRLQEVSEGILEGALFTLPTGPAWYRHRKLLQPAFGPLHLQDTAMAAQERVEVAIKNWSRKELVVDMYTSMCSITVDVIGRIAFGHEYNCTELCIIHNQELQFVKDIDLMTRSISRRMLFPNFMWSLVGVGLRSPKLVAAQQRFRDLLNPLIDERKEYWANHKDELQDILNGNSHSRNWNVLDRLLYSQTTGTEGTMESFTNQEILEEMLGFFGAGFETTSNTLVWIIYELSRHPDIVDKIREEVKSVCEFSEGKWNILDHLNDFVYLGNVIKEAQRLHTVVIALRKDAMEDVHVLGQDFEAGRMLQVNIIAIHRHPKYWKDPLTFNPDRFSQVNSENVMFMPFGDGAMKCIGFRMANIELKVVVANMAMAFDFGYIEQEIESITSVTHGLKNGLKVLLKPI